MSQTLLFLIYFYINVIEILAQENNICKTWKAYLNPENNPDCWYDPDVGSDLLQTLENHHIPTEIHTTISKDGYILNTYRMVQNDGEIVVLEPPMTGTGVNYLKSGDSSLGFALYEAGFDVWLANPRGTFYSRNHTYLNENNSIYWDFSFHEIGIYDYPATFELIHNITEKYNFIVIGYSMACAAEAVYATLLPNHAKKYVKTIIAIGPTIYTIKPFVPPEVINVNKLREFLFRLGQVTVLKSFEKSKNDITRSCNGHPFRMMCVIGMSRNGGGTPYNFDPTVVPRLLSNNPMRVSLRMIVHYRQIARSRYFRQFDYGANGNLMHYNSEIPPDYPTNQISVPFYMIYGENDTTASVEYVNRFYDEMSDIGRTYGKHMIKTYNHVDYLYAKNSKEEVVDHIINFIRQLN